MPVNPNTQERAGERETDRERHGSEQEKARNMEIDSLHVRTIT
jgi:hypothetical protein